METRKIQEVGGGTFTVSLPKEWASSVGLEAGSVVDLHSHLDGLLVIQASETDQGPGRVTASIPADEPDRPEQVLRAAYAAGARKVELAFPAGVAPVQRRAVQRVTHNLTGVTVAEETDERIVVQTLLDPAEVSVGQSVRELRFVALSMHRDATAAVAGDGTFGDAPDRDDQADRLYALVDRHFARGLWRLDEVDALGTTRPDLFELWATARALERVADQAVTIAGVATGLGQPLEGDLAAEVRDVCEVARSVVADGVRVVVGDADPEAGFRALAERRAARDAIDSIERAVLESERADYRLARLFDAVRRTAEQGGNVAELGLRAAIRRGDLGDGAGEGVPRDDGTAGPEVGG